MSEAAVTAQNIRPIKPSFRIASPTRPLLQIRSGQGSKKKILFVTSELTDLVKTGGLGDVSAALPRALSDLHDSAC